MKYMKKSFTGMVPYHSKLITDGIILNANESPILPPQKVLDGNPDRDPVCRPLRGLRSSIIIAQQRLSYYGFLYFCE